MILLCMGLVLLVIAKGLRRVGRESILTRQWDKAIGPNEGNGALRDVLHGNAGQTGSPESGGGLRSRARSGFAAADEDPGPVETFYRKWSE